MIQDLSGSWCMKGTGESVTRVDSPVPLMHHDPDRSWITDPNSDHLKGTHSPVPLMYHDPDRSGITDPNSDHPKERTLSVTLYNRALLQYSIKSIAIDIF